MKKQLCVLGLVSLLAACSDSGITDIKESRLNQYPEFTIEQAFDHRKACSETEWISFSDERERNVIEYRCHLKGVVAHYISKAEKPITQHQNHYEKMLMRIESDRTIQMEGIKNYEERLANAKAETTDTAKQKYSDDRWNKFNQQEEILTILSENGIEYFSDQKHKLTYDYIPEKHRLNTLALRYKNNRKALLEANKKNNKGLAEIIHSKMEDNKNEFSRFKHEAILNLKKEIDFERANAEYGISLHLKNIESSVTYIEKRLTLARKNLNEIDFPAEKQKIKIEEAQQNYNEMVLSSSSINAFEFYRWVIIDNGEFQVTEAGMVLNLPGKDPKTTTYKDLSAPLKIVYQNKVTDFETYKKTISSMAWGKFLGY